MSKSKEIRKKPDLQSGFAGGSGGALLIFLAQSLPLEYAAWSQLLMYIAPFFGIGINVFWIWAKQRISERLKNRALKKYIKECKLFLQNALEDPKISNTRKKELKKKYDELNRILTNIHFNKIKSVKFDNEFKTIISAFDEIMENTQENKVKQIESEEDKTEQITNS